MLRIAHRGAPHLAPENSLEGFEKALAFGPDMVEMDVRRTADGKAVVMHDPTVDRTTDGRGKIAKMPFAKVRERRLKNGEPVPSLADALDLLKGRAGIKLDVKDIRLEDAIVAELRRVGVIRQAIVIAYGRKALASFRSESPSLRLEVGGIYSRRQRRPAIDDARWTGATVISARHTIVSKRFADECSEDGLAIHAWTVNDRATADRMHALGVEAIATDRLDLV
jgi:glycerophosphoryl diester phosphodiesterase